MSSFTQKLILQVIFLFFTLTGSAQVWPTPEVQQMYQHANEYMAAGNFKDAVTTYKQAIKIASDVMILYRDLGDALYRAGDYDEAEKVLTPLITKQEVDERFFLLLAETQLAEQEQKPAIATLKKGITRFPNSGMLYHEQGKIFAHENDDESALNSWLDGITKNATYAQNYFDAAQIYLSSEDVLWGLIYAEQYLAMQHDTTHDDELKNKLLKGYKIFFDNLVSDETPQYGKASKQATVNTFEDAVRKTYSTLTPVVSDGITTENLTMVRARFLMEWGGAYAKKYPFPLFVYMDKVIRNGRFDMYNEWLFGKAESTTEFKAWNEFHEGDLQRFLQWKSANEFIPSSTDNYNTRDMKGLFKKEKNKHR